MTRLANHSASVFHVIDIGLVSNNTKHHFSLVPFGHLLTKPKILSAACCNHVIMAL